MPHNSGSSSGSPKIAVDLRRLLLLSIAGLAVFGAFLVARGSGDRTETSSGTAIEDAKVLQPSGVAAEAKAGALAPDFEASTLTGERVRLSDYHGKAVVLNFWGTSCVSCLAEIPHLQRLWQERAPEGLVVLGVNVGDDVSRAQRFFSTQLGATYTSVLDPRQTLAKTYRAPGLPMTLFINAEGRIERIIVGEISYQIFDRFARVALGEKNVAGVNDPLPLRFVSPLPPLDEEGGTR